MRHRLLHRTALDATEPRNETDGGPLLVGPAAFIPGTRGNDTLIGTAEDDTLDGGQGVDRLYGGLGNDTLYGGLEYDTLDGGLGADAMFGGRGNDTYRVDHVDDVATEFDDHGKEDRVVASVDCTLSRYVEHLNLVGTADINGTGNRLSNVISGNQGNNTLHGMEGDDYLSGGRGDDALYGGFGKDYLYGEDGNDTLDGGGDSRYDPNSTNVLDGGAGKDVLRSDNSFSSMLGGAGSDTLIGSGETSRMYGQDGDDLLQLYGGGSLDGGVGNDTLIGAGNSWFADTLHDDADTIDGSRGIGTDALTADWGAATTDIVWINRPDEVQIVEGNTITGIERLFMFCGSGNDAVAAWREGTANNRIDGGAGNDTLTGGSGADSLTGGSGEDSLIAGSGNDTLIGGAGLDTLSGKSGLDSFLFNTVPHGANNFDTLNGFSTAEDTILLENGVFVALGVATGPLAEAQFRAGAAAADADDRIVYNSANGQLLYDADGNGAGAAVLFAQLSPGTAVTAADFVIV